MACPPSACLTVGRRWPQIKAQYANKANEPSHNVTYVECSAQTNKGLEPIFAESLLRIRQLPSRSRIRTARMRVTGFCGKLKQTAYSCCPFMFDVEDCFKKWWRSETWKNPLFSFAYATIVQCRSKRVLPPDFGAPHHVKQVWDELPRSPLWSGNGHLMKLMRF